MNLTYGEKMELEHLKKQNLSKQEAIRLHREMWKRISELNDDEIKDKLLQDIKCKTIKDMGIKEHILLSCFCCEYNGNDCTRCPIDWGNQLIDAVCSSPGSPYLNLYRELKNKNFSKFRNLAKQISELPERRDVE